MSRFLSSRTQTRHSMRATGPFTCQAFEDRFFGVVISKRSSGLVINGRLAPEARSDVGANYMREEFFFFLVLFWTRRNASYVADPAQWKSRYQKREEKLLGKKKKKKLKSEREEEVGEIERAAARRARDSHSIFSTAT